jgi:small-conductance mechanosensitive channel
MPWWERLAIVAGVIAASAILAKLIDFRLRRKQLTAHAETRYRVLRRVVMAGTVVLGILSSLLVIPEVRALAGGLLASSAVLGLIIGFAAQRTLANFAAGVLIAFTQPLRLGDTVAVGDDEGVVEEIGLVFTFIRADDNTRLVIPNEKLASDTIRNSTIVSRETFAQITVQVPLTTDLENIVDLLREEVAAESEADAFVSALGTDATITLRVWAPNHAAAEQLESDLRLRVHRRLREHGLWTAA